MKKSPRSRLSASARPSGWRLAVISSAFLAFVLQSFVVQTHIHFSPDSMARLAAYTIAHGTAHQDRRDNHPANEDPANCPICQEFLHSGQFVAPAAQALLPPSMAVSTVAVVDAALPFVLTLSHDWRGRAPPRI